VWAKLTESDIIVFSETWIKLSITNNIIHIDGYNLFRTESSLECCSIETITKAKFF